MEEEKMCKIWTHGTMALKDVYRVEYIGKIK
jgi:hypothetical protein